MTILPELFSLLKTQNCLLLLSLYEQKAIKNYENFLVKDLKDLYIGINIKQNLRMKIQQMSIDIFRNQTL